MNVVLHDLLLILCSCFYFSGSTNSLVAGLAFGCVLGYGAYQTSIDENNFLLSLGKYSPYCFLFYIFVAKVKNLLIFY